MGILILLGVIVGGAIVLLGIFQMMSDSRSGPVIPMVRIGIAASSIEMDMWTQRLKAAEVLCRVQGYSTPGMMGGQYVSTPYNAELWVREEDEEVARGLLGI